MQQRLFQMEAPQGRFFYPECRIVSISKLHQHPYSSMQHIGNFGLMVCHIGRGCLLQRNSAANSLQKKSKGCMPKSRISTTSRIIHKLMFVPCTSVELEGTGCAGRQNIVVESHGALCGRHRTNGFSFCLRTKNLCTRTEKKTIQHPLPPLPHLT